MLSLAGASFQLVPKTKKLFVFIDGDSPPPFGFGQALSFIPSEMKNGMTWVFWLLHFTQNLKSRSSDLLEQIKSVDEMIALHQKKGDAEDVMLLQYYHRRNKFLADFKKVLKDLNINAKDLAA